MIVDICTYLCELFAKYFNLFAPKCILTLYERPLWFYEASDQVLPVGRTDVCVGCVCMCVFGGFVWMLVFYLCVGCVWMCVCLMCVLVVCVCVCLMCVFWVCVDACV